MGLWNEEDGFFYDVLKFLDGGHFPVKVRCMVGLIPLLAVETLDSGLLHRLPGFKRRMEWFIENRPDLTENVACVQRSGMASFGKMNCWPRSARPECVRKSASTSPC
jgi:hypothetical protein